MKTPAFDTMSRAEIIQYHELLDLETQLRIADNAHLDIEAQQIKDEIEQIKAKQLPTEPAPTAGLDWWGRKTEAHSIDPHEYPGHWVGPSDKRFTISDGAESPTFRLTTATNGEKRLISRIRGHLVDTSSPDMWTGLIFEFIPPVTVRQILT